MKVTAHVYFSFIIALSAEFGAIYGVCRLDNGDLVVSDHSFHRIRMISNAYTYTLAGDGTSGFANGQGSYAKFNNPSGVFCNQDGSILVLDSGNNQIRRITIDRGLDLK